MISSMGPCSNRTNVVVDVSRIDNTRLCNGPTHSLASCVPHADVVTFLFSPSCNVNDTADCVGGVSESTTNQLKHWPLVSVAEGRNSLGETRKSIHGFSGVSNSRSDDSRRMAGIFVGEVEGDDDDDNDNDVTLFGLLLDFFDDGGVIIVVVIFVVACEEEDAIISRGAFSCFINESC